MLPALFLVGDTVHVDGPFPRSMPTHQGHARPSSRQQGSVRLCAQLTSARQVAALAEQKQRLIEHPAFLTCFPREAHFPRTDFSSAPRPSSPAGAVAGVCLVLCCHSLGRRKLVRLGLSFSKVQLLKPHGECRWLCQRQQPIEKPARILRRLNASVLSRLFSFLRSHLRCSRRARAQTQCPLCLWTATRLTNLTARSPSVPNFWLL